MAPRKKNSARAVQGDEIERTESQSGRVKWTPELLHILCDICIQFTEKSKGKRGEIIGQRLLWKKIAEEFQKKTNLPWDKPKLKNKIDLVRTTWNLWKQLKVRETGVGWDEEKGTISGSDEWWIMKIKENPKFETFRDEGIEPYLESKLDSIFQCAATGLGKYTPMAEPPPQLDVNEAYVPLPPHMDDMNESFRGNSSNVMNHWKEVWHVDEDLASTPTSISNPSMQSSQNEGGDNSRKGKRVAESDSSQSNKSARCESSKRPGSSSSILGEKIADVMELITNNRKESRELQSSMANLINVMTINASKYSITDAYAQLCSVFDESDTTTPMFYFACTMIEDDKKRAIFMELPNKERKLGYIKYQFEAIEACKRH